MRVGSSHRIKDTAGEHRGRRHKAAVGGGVTVIAKGQTCCRKQLMGLGVCRSVSGTRHDLLCRE